MKNNYVETGRINQKLETREQILISAQYFMSKGLSFTLEDVAKKAGISRATIYRYYSNKDVLANEAGLDLNTEAPETIYQSLEQRPLKEQIHGVQDYFNQLALDHEKAFRNYLSTNITSETQEKKRGARRKRTMELVLDNNKVSKEDQERLSNIMTVLMGIEPMIVAKDVLALDDKESKELLSWSTDLLLKGFFNSK